MQWSASVTPDGLIVRPAGIALDPLGNIYLTDAAHDRVLKFRSDGFLLGQWGGKGCALGEFSTPTAIVVGPTGELLVADTYNDRIQRLAPSGAFLGSWGSPGRGPGEFRRPRGLAVALNGEVLVSDAINERVQRFSPVGKYLGEWSTGGEGVPLDDGRAGDVEQPPDPSESGGLAPLALAGQPELLIGPGALAVDQDGLVYVLMPKERRVRVFTADGTPVRIFDVGGSGGNGLQDPQGLAVDAAGIVYVADSGNGRVLMFTATGFGLGGWNDLHRSQVPGEGRPGDDVEQLSTTVTLEPALQIGGQEVLDTPSAVATDPRGHVFVTDSGLSSVLRYAFATPPARIQCDLQPGVEVNTCYLGCCRLTPLAIFGSWALHVSNVELSSVRVGNLGPPADLRVEDVGGPEHPSAGPDGIPDLVFAYTHRQILSAACLHGPGATSEITVYGLRRDGSPFWGTESVTAQLQPPAGLPGRPGDDLEQLRYVLPTAEWVRVRIFDVNGRLVDTPVDGFQPAGERVVRWNAAGRAQGIYFYLVESASVARSGRLTILR